MTYLIFLNLASIPGISTSSLISTKNLNNQKTILHEVKINTPRLVRVPITSTSTSSIPIITTTTIITSIAPINIIKNISTTCGGSLTTTPKTIFTLKTAPITSIVSVNDDNNKRFDFYVLFCLFLCWVMDKTAGN